MMICNYKKRDNKRKEQMTENNQEIFTSETEIKALQTLNEVEESTKRSIQLITNDDSKYQVKDFDALLEQINLMNDFIRSKEYTDEEEKSYKKLRAKINKVKASITSEVNQSIAYHFDELKRQSKVLKDALTETTDLLDENIKKSVEKMKLAKKEELLKTYNDLSMYDKRYGDLALDDFFNQKWLNKSYSMEKAKNELIERLDLFLHIADKIQENMTFDKFQEKYKLIDLIKRANWNLLTFETRFGELYLPPEVEEEKEEVIKDEEKQKEQKVEEKQETMIRLEVEVPMSQFKEVMNFFNKLNISSSVLD